jgi:hypothetical protein
MNPCRWQRTEETEASLTQTVFNKSDLIESCAESRREDHWHEDFKTYYTQLLEVLQPAFGVEISFEDVRNPKVKAIWFEFSRVIKSHLRLTGRDGFLEGGLIESQIELLGSKGDQINVTRSSLWQLQEQSREQHLKLLDELFDVLWEPIHSTVTHENLKNLGFNLNKPQLQDYWDKM